MAEESTGFGGLLRACRVAAGLSQEDLVRRSGLDVRTIRNLERGHAHWPYPDTVRRLADALNLRGADRDAFTVAAGRRLAPATGEAGGGAVAGSGLAAGAVHLGGVSGSTSPGVPAELAEVPSPEALGQVWAGRRVSASAAPSQLPAGIADFTGREAYASRLRQALAGAGDVSCAGAVPIVVIAGAAGSGKTTLAVHAAHQVKNQFPDGQLFVQMSGASGRPAVPGEVLARLLRDLGVDGDKVPAGEEERAALYRTRLADRRVLLLLDDAKDAAQVRPLLPGSASCAVVLTTRNRAVYLAGGGRVDLDTLPAAEALELLSRVVGAARVDAEPDAAGELLRACAGLPLAIRICSARLATRPQWPVAAMAARLRDEQRRLDELAAGDLEVRASFQVSYESIRDGGGAGPDPARAFRLLGLWQGPRISLPAAAALTGQREQDMAIALETLVDANLLESPGQGWYEQHDLLRLFAAERAQAEETPQEQATAVARLLHWYLATVTAAADFLSPYRYRIPDDDEPPAALPHNSAQDALAWYDHERAGLVFAVRLAADSGLHQVAWRLATALFELFARRHDWAECISVHRIAVSSAQASRSPLGEAWALHNMGFGLASTGDATAFGYLRQAAAVRRELGDPDGECQAAIAIAEAHHRIHGPQQAYDHLRQNLELLRRTGNLSRLAVALNNHGKYCQGVGRTDEATECLQEALALVAATGAGLVLGPVLANLGLIHLEAGRFQEAIASLSKAHRLCAAHGHLLGQALALRDLGQAQLRGGQANEAKASTQAALTMFKELKATAEIESTRSVIASLAQPANTDVS
jgi:tetratricopeptide (TPR) repeat protein